MNVYAIILAGGNGERFWPISTPERPKQFVDLFGGKPLLRHAVDRLKGVVPNDNILVITAERFVKLTREVLPMIPAANVVGEPCRRDTAAAVALATGLVRSRGGEDAIGLILTADHLMSPVKDFRKTLKAAIKVARTKDDIVTIGIVPTRPDTGYGYIDPEAKKFVEKPDLKTAKRYFKSGKYLWNSGMFIWKASVMKAAFAAQAPDFLDLIEKPSTKNYAALRAISVDYAIMEKTRNLSVVRGDFTWNDVGGYLSLPTFFAADDAGNTRLGRTVALETRDSIIISSGAHPVAVMGLKGVVVVETPKGTLVCDKSRLKDLKRLVNLV